MVPYLQKKLDILHCAYMKLIKAITKFQIGDIQSLIKIYLILVYKHQDDKHSAWLLDLRVSTHILMNGSIWLVHYLKRFQTKYK